MFNRDFDPYDILQSHEETVNNLIKAHNELAAFSESLAAELVTLNNRITHLESLSKDSNE